MAIATPRVNMVKIKDIISPDIHKAKDMDIIKIMEKLQ